MCIYKIKQVNKSRTEQRMNNRFHTFNVILSVSSCVSSAYLQDFTIKGTMFFSLEKLQATKCINVQFEIIFWHNTSSQSWVLM